MTLYSLWDPLTWKLISLPHLLYLGPWTCSSVLDGPHFYFQNIFPLSTIKVLSIACYIIKLYYQIPFLVVIINSPSSYLSLFFWGISSWLAATLSNISITSVVISISKKMNLPNVTILHPSGHLQSMNISVFKKTLLRCCWLISH